MSTLVMTAASQAGTALVQTAQQTALSYANRAISNFFDTRNFQGPKLESFLVQTSRDGASMARIYGRVRLAGQVIWASQLLESDSTESVGSKGGGPTQTSYSYSVSFAVGLCEGEILSVERIWANGAVLNTQDISYQVYKGTADQSPDPVISAVEGDDVPAFRNTAYIVFENFSLDGYGSRLPQINVEIIRVPAATTESPRLETLVQGVNLLPSSGEYAYSPNVAEEIFGPGTAQALNMNNSSGEADFSKAIDQLENELPNCKSVSIIISWFGTDLRCGSCEIRPGVETESRTMVDATWSVGPDTRDTAYVVGQDAEARPNFGGTPSDQSIIDAILDLKSRGYKVSLYPFILMDISSGNGLSDPYGGTEQSAFPWRGRITSDPAPGLVGTPEKTSAVTTQIDLFFGACETSDFGVSDDAITYSGPSEFGFRRFILHYAKLAALAGGVDRFIIGSEMRGVTTLRSGTHSYPAVDRLVTLAADAKSIVGSSTDVSYAADWSEYFGHHPEDGSGDVSFHLDPLWASDDIAAIGIDAYFPLSDWREGTEHLDAALAVDIYDTEYLSGNMEGGEGYAWYYASESDRDAQTRTLITDGVGKPWIYRYKDVRNWWLNPHYNRTAGVEESTPTAWQAESKPIWFTEIGCPAIDKGANQPNVFVDPKSSESFYPFYSLGSRDDLIQRRYVETFLSYWDSATGLNPTSSLYFGPMVDLDAVHIWCWDARPYPEFPALTEVWSDGDNWTLGHWLNGRTGVVPLADVVEDLTLLAGVDVVDVTKVVGSVQGYVLDRPMSTRAALEPLASIYGFNMVEGAEGLRFLSFGTEAVVDLSSAELSGESLADIEYVMDDKTLRLRDVRLHFIDPSNSYQIATVSARDLAAETVRVLDLEAPLVLSQSYASYISDHILRRAQLSGTSVSLDLPPNLLSVEVGDLLRLNGDDDEWRVESLESGAVQSITARINGESFTPNVSGSTPVNEVAPVWIAEPNLMVLDIPSSEDQSGPYIGAQLSPFSTVTVTPEFGADPLSVSLTRMAKTGTLLTALVKGPVGRWDKANSFTAIFDTGTFSSLTEAALLSGGNRFAVKTDSGWEIVQAQNAELVATQTYLFSTLLRGLSGSDTEQVETVPIGAEIIALDARVEEVSISEDYLGLELSLHVQAGQRVATSQTFEYLGRHLRPRTPVHGDVESEGASKRLSWVRQTRSGGDNWAAIEVPLGETREFYQIRLFQEQTEISSVTTTDTEVLLSAEDLGSADTALISQGSDIFGYGPELSLLL